jgi:hypothetical protein
MLWTDPKKKKKKKKKHARFLEAETRSVRARLAGERDGSGSAEDELIPLEEFKRDAPKELQVEGATGSVRAMRII